MRRVRGGLEVDVRSHDNGHGGSGDEDSQSFGARTASLPFLPFQSRHPPPPHKPPPGASVWFTSFSSPTSSHNLQTGWDVATSGSLQRTAGIDGPFASRLSELDDDIHITKHTPTSQPHCILCHHQLSLAQTSPPSSVPQTWTVPARTGATATISNRIGIQSILSPQDGSDSHNTPTLGRYQPVQKRHLSDTHIHQHAPLIPPGPAAYDTLPAGAPYQHATGYGAGPSPHNNNNNNTRDDRKPIMVGAFESKKSAKMRPPMRSSIACLRCRKSKIKCENTGGSSACEGCVKTGKDCIFETAGGGANPPKRVEPPAGGRQERDGGSDRKRLKRIDDMTKSESQKTVETAHEALNVSFLRNELIWERLLDLYKLHFAPELPFLHLPTMKEKITQKYKSADSVDPGPEFNLVLLGVLALTARFHPDLVRYVAQFRTNQPGGNVRSRAAPSQLDPSEASDHYADLLSMALGPVPRTASVERVQAMLMLGLYEWGQTRPKPGGLGAWMSIGGAIRLAQFLRLGLVDEPVSAALNATEQRPSQDSQLILEREIKRRTMFGCFVLDRMLACGKGRVTMIQRDDLFIQLPCSEDKFDLAIEVNTGFLSPRTPEQEERRDSTDDSVLSRFIRLMDIWGDISKYSAAGGRLTEKHPPWDQRTSFFQLNERLRRFDASLPGTFKFSESNYRKHENHQASSAFVLLHILRCISLIMLHREYIPFVPIRCEGPEGPLDEPTFPKNEYTWPQGFWVESAEHVFKAAREIVELIEICERKDRLPQSTLVLFGIWNAAFVGLYARHFPQMDQKQHMWAGGPNRDEESVPQVFAIGPTAVAYKALDKMSKWMKMASTYVHILLQMDKYFTEIYQEFFRHEERNRGDSNRPPHLFEAARKATSRIREGGSGGGLEEYETMRPQLKDFGQLNPIDSDRSRASTADRASSMGDDGTAPVYTPKSTPSSFTAINHGHQPDYPSSDPYAGLQSSMNGNGTGPLHATASPAIYNTNIFAVPLSNEEFMAHESQRLDWDMGCWIDSDSVSMPEHLLIAGNTILG